MKGIDSIRYRTGACVTALVRLASACDRCLGEAALGTPVWSTLIALRNSARGAVQVLEGGLDEVRLFESSQGVGERPPSALAPLDAPMIIAESERRSASRSSRGGAESPSGSG